MSGCPEAPSCFPFFSLSETSVLFLVYDTLCARNTIFRYKISFCRTMHALLRVNSHYLLHCQIFQCSGLCSAEIIVSLPSST